MSLFPLLVGLAALDPPYDMLTATYLIGCGRRRKCVRRQIVANMPDFQGDGVNCESWKGQCFRSVVLEQAVDRRTAQSFSAPAKPTNSIKKPRSPPPCRRPSRSTGSRHPCVPPVANRSSTTRTRAADRDGIDVDFQFVAAILQVVAVREGFGGQFTRLADGDQPGVAVPVPAARRI